MLDAAGQHVEVYVQTPRYKTMLGYRTKPNAMSAVLTRALPRLPPRRHFPQSHSLLLLALGKLTSRNTFRDENRFPMMQSLDVATEGIFPSQLFVAVRARPHLARFWMTRRILDMADIVGRASKCLPAGLTRRRDSIRVPRRALTGWAIRTFVRRIVWTCRHHIPSGL